MNVKKNWLLLFLALGIVIVGSVLAWSIDTVGGSVKVKLVDFVGDNGTVLHGRLYIPDGVTSENPAPGVLFIHGGDASSDKYSMFSVEFARRGYVVFNFDQRGHGFSEGLPFEKGYGGPEALRFLHNLDIVDSNKIAMVGHSMGGSAISAAAVEYPDYYSSIVFLGCSSPIIKGTDPSILRNVAYICGLNDAGWRTPEVIAPLFGVDNLRTVKPGEILGSIADGTAKILYYVSTIHNAEYIHPPTIGYTIDWVQKTVSPPRYLAPSNQIWWWRYLGTTIALAGAIFFILQLGALMLKTSFFKTVAEPLPEFHRLKGKPWWIAAIITSVFPPATLFWFHNLTAKSTVLWPYNRITGLMGWSVLVAIVTVVLLLVNHFVLKADKGATLYHYGLTWKEKQINWLNIGKSFLLAISIIASTYLVVAIAYHTFKIDFRMWNEGLRLMTLKRIWVLLRYLVPFVLAYIVFAANLHGLLRPKGRSAGFGRELLTNILIMAPWYYIWAIWLGPFSYIRSHPAGPFNLGFMRDWFWALPPVMLMWTVISTYFYHKTGKVYVGAFINAFLVCWISHFAPLSLVIDNFYGLS